MFLFNVLMFFFFYFLAAAPLPATFASSSSDREIPAVRRLGNAPRPRARPRREASIIVSAAPQPKGAAAKPAPATPSSIRLRSAASQEAAADAAFDFVSAQDMLLEGEYACTVYSVQAVNVFFFPHS